MNKKEIIGYIIAIKGAGLIVPICILEGITHFNYLCALFWDLNIKTFSPFFWFLAIIGLFTVFTGLSIAASNEKEPNFFQ